MKIITKFLRILWNYDHWQNTHKYRWHNLDNIRCHTLDYALNANWLKDAHLIAKSCQNDPKDAKVIGNQIRTTKCNVHDVINDAISLLASKNHSRKVERAGEKDER